jgi:hypothetical protein
MATPQWTMMLYLSGDNNLSPEMVRAINDIGETGVPAEINLAIQYAPVAPNAPTYRYFLPAGTKPVVAPTRGPLPLPAFAKIVSGAPSAASPKTLEDFIVASLKKYKNTPNRMLALSGHGNGAVGDFLTDENPARKNLRSLSIPGLRKALKNAQKTLKDTGKKGRLIQVLGMDSCLMSMIEVCYEVRDFVEYLVGSEGFVPNAGWPYAYLLEDLERKIKNGESLTPEFISESIVDGYLDFYGDYIPASVSVDIAACELKKLDGVTKSLSKLADLLTKGMASNGGHANGSPDVAGELQNKADERPDSARELQNRVILAHWRAQSFKREQNTDISDFCDQLAIETRGRFPEIANACEAVIETVKHATLTQGNVGIDTQHAQGLALYFPWNLPIFGEARVLEPYSQLQFSKVSRWGKFIKSYVHETRRPPKGNGTIWPPAEFIKRVNNASLPTNGGAGVRDGGDEDRAIADDDRVLLQLFGSRALPWSMKNPPQQIKIRHSRGARQESSRRQKRQTALTDKAADEG